MQRITKTLFCWFVGSCLLTATSLPVALGASEPPVPAQAEQASADPGTRVLDLSKLYGLPALLDQLAHKRTVYVGESHDRYEDHLNQLEIIKGLHQQNPNLAIGMEFFQQPFQSVLDQYVVGTISEEDLLKRTEYFERWRFDYRLYQPILRYAREHRIPLVALNLPAELTKKVGAAGIEGLSDEEKRQIPKDLDRTDEVYRERVKMVFEHHPKSAESDFEHFYEVQLLWDEGMAERAARYLQQNPGKRLVVLAGVGHLEYGQGIPQRVKRRVPDSSAIVLSGVSRGVAPSLADYMLFPEPVELPKPGLLGVFLDTDRDGVTAKGFSEDSGAEAAGLEKGDKIVRVGTQPVNAYGDIRIALLNRAPGDKVPVSVLRKRVLLDDEQLTFEVELR